MEKVERDKKIKAEKRKLASLLKSADANLKKAVDSLIENAAFMAVTLNELQEQITENGTVSEYKNGENQFGTKKSPEVEVYNTMIKNYSAVVKQICDILPEAEARDDFLTSLGAGRK